MSPDDDLRLLVHLYNEQGQGLVCLIFASAKQDFPELLAVDGVVRLLEVDESRVTPPLLSLPRVDLRKESRHVGGSGGAFFEACLVYSGL